MVRRMNCEGTGSYVQRAPQPSCAGRSEQATSRTDVRDSCYEGLARCMQMRVPIVAPLPQRPVEFDLARIVLRWQQQCRRGKQSEVLNFSCLPGSTRLRAMRDWVEDNSYASGPPKNTATTDRAGVGELCIRCARVRGGMWFSCNRAG